MSVIKLTQKTVAHIVSISRSSSKTPTQIFDDLLKNPKFNPSLKPLISCAHTFPFNGKTAYYSGFLCMTAKLSKAGNSIKCRVGTEKGKILSKLVTYFNLGVCNTVVDKNGNGDRYTRYVWHTDYADFVEWFKATGLDGFFGGLLVDRALIYTIYPKEFLAGCIDGSKTKAVNCVRLKFKSAFQCNHVSDGVFIHLNTWYKRINFTMIELMRMGHAQLDRLLKDLRP